MITDERLSHLAALAVSRRILILTCTLIFMCIGKSHKVSEACYALLGVQAYP